MVFVRIRGQNEVQFLSVVCAVCRKDRRSLSLFACKFHARVVGLRQFRLRFLDREIFVKPLKW